MALEHPAHIQVFQHNHRLGSRQDCGGLMHGIFTNVRHASMGFCQLPQGFLALARKYPNMDFYLRKSTAKIKD